MDIPLDEVIYFDVITSTPSTGAAVDADATPTFSVYEEATDTDIGVGGNLTKRTSLTGNYRGSFTASAANGFEVGKWYAVIVSATVGAVAGKCVARQFRLVAAETIAGTPKVDQVAIIGDTTAATNMKNVYGALETGTAQAGGASSITLRAGASAVTDYYMDQAVFILSGTGAGQTNRITAYDGTTKVATVGTTWATQPDNTSVYDVVGRIG
jgi:hypothetical protein